MATALVGVGSNLSEPANQIVQAAERLGQHARVVVTARSSVHVTRPIGGPPGQPLYANAAWLVETSLDPEALWTVLHEVEAALGRTRSTRWGPRVIDLDLLLYDQVTLQTDRLELPHPRMAFRRFVLQPAAEVAAGMLHPPTGRTVEQLLRHLDSAVNYLTITGVPGSGQTTLAERVAARSGAISLLDQLAPVGEANASPSRPPPTGLELLRRRVERLRIRSGRGPWISDFWIEDSLAFAESSAEKTELLHEWEGLRSQVVPPKFIVLLETAAGGARLEALRERLRLPNQPPVLRLSAADAAWNEEEVSALIQEMQ